MQTIFSTADVPRTDAFDYWMEVACANIAKHEVKPFDRREFSAWMQAGLLAGLPIACWGSAPHNARAGSNDTDDLLLLFHTRTEQVRFAGHSIEMNSNGLVLFDTREAYVARAAEPIEAIGVHIPREVLAQRIRITRDVVNHPLPLEGDAALLTAFVREIVRIGPSTLSPAAAAIAREQMMDLTAIVLGDRTGSLPRLGAAARFGTLRLRVFIESQLTNPDADAQSIAAGAGVSERHANRLLALEGTSIRRLLIERRLDKCREMIEDPQHLHRSIRDIAFFYAFRNLSHFTRAFKDRFGLSPGEYRSAFHPLGH